MSIKQGDIVASDGRIETQQDGHRRFIEFAAAEVLSVDGRVVTVTPVGKKAVLACLDTDLLSQETPGSLQLTGEVAEEAKQPEKPSLANMVKRKPAPKAKPAVKPTAKKPPARRRRKPS